MRWQGCVETPNQLRSIVSVDQMAALDGIFYTCKSNKGIYVLKANSIATPITDVVIKVGSEYTSTPGRFIKMNDVFIDTNENGGISIGSIPADIGMSIVKGISSEVFLKISNQLIQIGQWPGVA